jgi:taurine--2-oxoglutarate transaminase
MIATAKGLTSGYIPMGALIVSDRLAASYETQPLMLGLTYSAHPVACAAALEVLQIYEDDQLIENASIQGQYIDWRIEEMKAIHPCIGDFRNTGLLGCLELVKNRKTKEPMAPFNALPSQMEIMDKVAERIKALGMYSIVRWNYIFIAPPLSITREEVEKGLAILHEALTLADEFVNE